MKRSLLVLVLTLPLMAQTFHIDHVTVAGKDLKAMQRALEAAGIPSEYGGPHSNHATEMALASFPDGSYLELIAIQPHADPASVTAHYWHKFLESDGTPCAWAIRPADFEGEVARLRHAGIAVDGPHRNGRKRPDGVVLDWETAQIGPTNGGFFPFLIHDFTPRDNRAYPSGKPTKPSVTGVVKVVIGVRDIGMAVAEYRKAYGLPMPQLESDPAFGARIAWFPGTPVVLASPLGADSWLRTHLEQFGEAPCAFVLGVKTFASSSTIPPSKWFGARIFWAPSKPGWRLGFELQ